MKIHREGVLLIWGMMYPLMWSLKGIHHLLERHHLKHPWISRNLTWRCSHLSPFRPKIQQQQQQTTTTGENEVEAENVEPHEVPVPDWGSADEDGLCAFGDDLIEPEHDAGVWEIKLATESFNACDDIPHENDHDPIHTLFAEHVLIASNARKQKVEVQYRHLSSEDQKLFDAAKQKEIKAWIDHGTVQKVTRGTLKPEQIMRCRWILTWKAPEVGGVE